MTAWRFLLESSSAGNMRNFVRADDSVGSTNNRIRFTDNETGVAWADGSWAHYVFAWSVDASAEPDLSDLLSTAHRSPCRITRPAWKATRCYPL